MVRILREPERICYECRYLRNYDEGAKVRIMCGQPSFGSSKQMKKCERCEEEITNQYKVNCPRCFALVTYHETEFLFPYGEVPRCSRFEEKPPALEQLRDAIRELQQEIKKIKEE